MPPKRLNNLKSYFLAGVVALLPIGVTLFIFYFLITTLGHIFGSLLHFLPFMSLLPQAVTTVIGFVLLMLIILVVGVVAAGAPGGWVLRRVSDFVERLPLIRGIYGTARQLTDAVLVDRQSLRKVVLIEYPRTGIYALAFLMSDQPVKINRRDCYTIFIPTTPTPTAGWVNLIPADAITDLEIGVDDALKLFISGGIVIPEGMKQNIAFPSRGLVPLLPGTTPGLPAT
jgi:uncharacterized membrane protein